MNITYSTKGSDDYVTVTVANCQVPIHGRWTDFKITAYSMNGGTSINFAIQPLQSDLSHHCSTFDATIGERHLRLSRKSTRGLQEISQEITFQPMKGIMLHWSELPGGGVDAGRTVARAILRKMESIVETIRQDIRRYLSSEVRQQALLLLHTRYHTITEGVVKQFLNEINWGMMLRGAECDAETLTTIIGSLDGRNPIDWYSIAENGDTGIDRVVSTDGVSFDRSTLANLKATGLLRTVCGATLGDEFDKTGGITFEQNDYTFKARPGDWVDCYDPNGKHARLCIHTLGFQCNPIDEVVFAFLNIRNLFDEYMTEAIYHNVQRGFVKPSCCVQGVAA